MAEKKMESKPGWKTTEFWATLLLPVVSIIVSKAFGVEITPEIMDGALGIFGVTGGAYVISRGVVKHGDPTPEKK